MSADRLQHLLTEGGNLRVDLDKEIGALNEVYIFILLILMYTATITADNMLYNCITMQ